MLISSRAPLRVSFGGGGTDIPPYSEKEGGAVLNVTINKYAYVFLTPRQDNLVKIKTLDYPMEITTTIETCHSFNGELDLIKAAISQMNPPAGMDLILFSDAPPGSGLGASSAITVAILAALARWLKNALSPWELAEAAFYAEREKASIKGGRQDQYASVFGGLNWLEFYNDETIVNPPPVSPVILDELQSRLLLCYTGFTRRSDLIIKQQMQTYSVNREKARQNLDQIKEIALQMKKSLLKGDLEEFGSLLDSGWVVKKRLCPMITNHRIEELYTVGKKYGALGGRILGAGGGGYLLFFCKKERLATVVEKLEEYGGKVQDFKFCYHGVQTRELNKFGGN
ncbi:MAG: GHMP kinase [Bacillota bacterium]